jgi:hypothetical protein
MSSGIDLLTKDLVIIGGASRMINLHHGKKAAKGRGEQFHY